MRPSAELLEERFYQALREVARPEEQLPVALETIRRLSDRLVSTAPDWLHQLWAASAIGDSVFGPPPKIDYTPEVIGVATALVNSVWRELADMSGVADEVDAVPVLVLLIRTLLSGIVREHRLRFQGTLVAILIRELLEKTSVAVAVNGRRN